MNLNLLMGIRMRREIFLIVGMVFLFLVLSISAVEEIKKEDIIKKIAETNEPYVISSGEKQLMDLFHKAVTIKNAEISIKSENGRELIEINFLDGGYMFERINEMKGETSAIIFGEYGKGKNTITFDKNMDVVKAHLVGLEGENLGLGLV